MTKQKIPTKPGAPFGGGYYAGRFFIGKDCHALIVSPRAEGEIESVAWSDSSKNVTGALSYCDGMANTKAMAKAGSALAKRILDLRIGGFKDWHLPARLPALILFGELVGLKLFSGDGKETFAREWYWTSTQCAAYPDYAWAQYFGDGYQGYGHKSSEFRARAVRTIKI